MPGSVRVALGRPQAGSGTASPMEVTSAVGRRDSEPQPGNGCFLRSWPCPQEHRTPSPVAPQPPRMWGAQLQDHSVLESKVRALKEKMTAGKQGAGPCSTSQRTSPKKPRCRRVKARTPSEASSLPDAAGPPPAQNPTDRQLDRSVPEEEPAGIGGPRPPRPPTPRPECRNGRSLWPAEAVWTLPGNGRSLWPAEAVWTLPDQEKGMLLGSGSAQERPTHRATPGWPGSPGPVSRTSQMPGLRKGGAFFLPDGLVGGGDLDSTSFASEEDFVLPGGLWRAVGAGPCAVSLSDRVERNRLLLQEMLRGPGQSTPEAGATAQTPSWDGTAAERPAGDLDWDSGISLQDSDQNRTFGPKPEPVLSPRHEEAKHLLQRARMKARTRPLRASHDIMPSITQGRCDVRSSPAQGPRMPSVGRDGLQNEPMSDSSSGESSSGQWPRRGLSPSHVRFEDESACDAEWRHLERLQQRQPQRQVLHPKQKATGQGPLLSKPNMAQYVSGGLWLRDAGEEAFCRLMDRWGLPAKPLLRGPGRRCRACGSCIESQDPAKGRSALAPPSPRVLQELQAACGMEVVREESDGSHSLQVLSAEPGLHLEWIRETHIGAPECSEEVDSALDSTDTSDSCRTDSEEAGASRPSKACGRTRLRSSRPRGGHRWPRKTEAELGDAKEGAEMKEGRGHTPERMLFQRQAPVPQPPAPELKKASPGAQPQTGPGPGPHWACPVDSQAPCRTACATASSMKLGPLGPGRRGQMVQSQESLEAVSTSSQQKSLAEPPAPDQAQHSPAALCPESWVPTPPTSRKTTSPVSHRKAALTGPHRPSDQREPVDAPLPPSRSASLGPCELTPRRTQPCRPRARHPLLALSTNNCNNSVPVPQGLQEPRGGAVCGGPEDRGPCSREPTPPLESGRDGHPGSVDVATVNSTSITLSLASEELESSREAEGGSQRTEASSGGHTPSQAPPGAGTGPRPPSAASSDRHKKRSSSVASTLGLRKFFSALGQSSRPKLAKSRSYSVEQLQATTPGPAPHTRAPSLQSLHQVSPSHQRRKAASFQNLHSLLSGKGDRSSLYLVGRPGDNAAGRLAKAPARRALSVEDVSAPSLARTVGRVVEVFPDGTSQLQLQRSPEGTFGFCVASGNGRRDSGLYVQAMADSSTAKLYSGLLGVGDEILEVNGAKVAGLGLAHIQELLAHSETLSVRVLRQRPVPR
ncbi:uncharacterized protein KIAA1614 homolog [Tupaia chinensis]|uniref:uncharacterized protein KIAA1614 homolog n=1 Tax=Tupaia chinensis TaxID=246437 RepID=UPI0003C8C92F|nr:uncharacterized protein KIAA1614 homolog [Tupaia chinensis]